MTYIKSKSDDTEPLSHSVNLVEYIKSIKYPTDSLFPTTPTEDLSSINDG